MDRMTENKKRAGKKYRQGRLTVCTKHNLPCHWSNLCMECVSEKLPEVEKERVIHIDPTIMEQLLVKNIKLKPKMKSFF